MAYSILNYYIELLKSFRRFSSFNELSMFDTNTKNNKNEKIIFKVILEKNEYDENYYNILFHQETNIEATCDFILKNHKDNLLKLNNHIVYYFRAKRITERDEDIIESKIKPKKKYQIEALIRNISERYISDIYDTELFITPNAFVFPKIKQKNKVKIDEYIYYDDFGKFKTSFLDNWLERNQSSILVIKGEGGIGKTTIAKYFSNHFLNKNQHTSKIFIDSIEAKEFLLNNGNNRNAGKIDLYDLYSASLKGNQILNNELFKNNLDAGNFFIVIDGIDELISKIPNFDISHFLKSIQKYFSVINNTKILITCRTYFWDLDTSENYKIDSIEIKPFNYDQMKSFFEKSFHNDENKVVKALELAVEFHKNKIHKDNFHPYALDIISRVIKSQKNIISDNSSSFSKLLNPNETLDYIVDRICNRENYLQDKVRVLDLSVTEQVSVFKTIATRYNGHMSISLLKNCISSSISKSVKKNIPDSLVEAFKTHLLINIDKSDVISFKYDFLSDFFKSVYISNYLSLDFGEEEISEQLIELFKVSHFGSNLAKEVTRRIVNWGDDELLKLSDIIEQIGKLNIEDKNMVFSGVFNIAFYINKKFKSNTTIDNTSLIKALFGQSGQIENLCLVNIFDSKYKIKFDFSNMVLKNCYFNNYTDFWSCTFDNRVFFTSCSLKLLGEKLSKVQIPFDFEKNVDKNCIYDKSFKNTFSKIDRISEEYRKEITEFIKVFLRFFYTRGTLWSRNYLEEKEKYKSFRLAFADFGDIDIEFLAFISIIKKINLASVFYHKKHQVEKVEINNLYKSEIVKFLEEDTHSEIVDTLEDEIFNSIRG